MHRVLLDITPFAAHSFSLDVDRLLVDFVDEKEILGIEGGEIDPGDQDLDQTLMLMERRLLEFETKVGP